MIPVLESSVAAEVAPATPATIKSNAAVAAAAVHLRAVV
jgi:hypothetical protein